MYVKLKKILEKFLKKKSLHDFNEGFLVEFLDIAGINPGEIFKTISVRNCVRILGKIHVNRYIRQIYVGTHGGIL